MKTIKLLICTLVAFIGFQSFAQIIATTPVNRAEPMVEQIANAYARADAAYYRGSYMFNGVSTNKVVTKVSAEYVLQMVGQYWGITQLKINGTNIPIDPNHPLVQFPPYLAGEVQEFNFSMNGYDKNDKSVRYGGFYKAVMAKNDEIKIIVDLAYVQDFVPFPLSGDHNSNNTTIRSDDGNYGGYYDDTFKAFRVNYDALYPPRNWVIIDTRNNSPIGIAPFKPTPSSDTNSSTGFGFNLSLRENIREVKLNQNTWVSLQQLKCDQVVVRAHTNYASKVIVVHADPSNYLMVYAYDLQAGSRLEVYGLTADSEKLVGQKVVPPDQYNWGTVSLMDMRGFEAYRVVIIGLPNDTINGFQTSFYSTSYPQQGSDGMGKSEGAVNGSEEASTPVSSSSSDSNGK